MSDPSTLDEGSLVMLNETIKQLEGKLATSEARNKELRKKIGRQRDNIITLSELLDGVNIDTEECERCDWIDWEENMHRCHSGSGILCCSRCGCTPDCNEGDKGDEGDEEEGDAAEINENGEAGCDEADIVRISDKPPSQYNDLSEDEVIIYSKEDPAYNTAIHNAKKWLKANP